MEIFLQTRKGCNHGLVRSIYFYNIARPLGKCLQSDFYLQASDYKNFGNFIEFLSSFLGQIHFS